MGTQGKAVCFVARRGMIERDLHYCAIAPVSALTNWCKEFQGEPQLREVLRGAARAQIAAVLVIRNRRQREGPPHGGLTAL